MQSMETTIRRSPADRTRFTLTFHRVGMRSRALEMHFDDLKSYLRDSDVGEQAMNTILGLPVGVAVTLNVSNAEADRALRRTG